MAKELLLKCEMRLIVLCLFAVFTAVGQSTTKHLPLTDTEKIRQWLTQSEFPNSVDEQQQSNH